MLLRQLESLSLLTRNKRIRDLVADELAVLRIVRQLAIEPHGNIYRVANVQHSIVSLQIGNWSLPRFDTLDEIVCVGLWYWLAVKFFDRV